MADMKRSNNIIVICAIDAQVETVKKLIPQIPCDVGLSTYGNTHCKPSKILNTLGYEHFDAPRQAFIPPNSEYHCNEMIAYLSISKHFYKSYKNVYLCHHDIEINKDPLPNYQLMMKGNWSFIAPLVEIQNGVHSTLDEVSKLGSHKARATNLRLSHELFILSEPFVNHIYDKYETDEEMWEKEFKDCCMHSDVNMFDILKYDGFEGKTIDSVVHHIEHEATVRPVINGILQV